MKWLPPLPSVIAHQHLRLRCISSRDELPPAAILLANRGLVAPVIAVFAAQQAQKANRQAVEGHNHEPH